ncbi:MAG: putative lipoprotein YiaD [Stenotrophomonas maltophilia]|nr:MAG: putative lipoprotein YiaD [Stenotrophomonas maltophilia]
MRLLTTSTLFICIGLSGCSQFQSSDASADAAPANAANSASASHWWWPFGDSTAQAEQPAAPAPAPAAQPAVAGSDSGKQGGHWWWPFGSSDAAQADAAKPAAVANAQVSKEWLDQREAALRAAVAGSKFTVERRDNALVLIAPVDTSFNPKRHELLLPVTLGPLGNVAKLVQNDPQSGVLVLGHSDSSGDKATNDLYSLDRAKAVASIFRLSGLGGDRLRLKGVGSTLPRADNGSAEGRALNRRVEVLLTQRGSLLALAQSN